MSAAPLRYQALWNTLGWALVALVVWLSLVPRPPQVGPDLGDKFHHTLAYFTLMFWFAQLHARRGQVALGLLGLGLTLEWLQGLTGYRQASGLDMLANGAGVLLGWAVARPPLNPFARIESLWP